MSNKKEYRELTKKTQSLLSSGENKSVEYKEQLKGLHAEDLVAFANSEAGGTILIGVKEEKTGKNSQIGVPCGCAIGDDQKLKIMSKALSCSPPVQIDIFVENISKAPFYRIEIPSGTNKPYSTNSGTYKIREDARNQPLLPEELLSMFLEHEGEEFRDRFSQASGQLEDQMQHTLSVVGDLEQVITSKIEEISSSMGWAEYEANSAKNTIEDVDAKVNTISHIVKNDQERLKTLLQHLEADDPIVEKAKKELLEHLINQLKDDEELLNQVKSGGSVSISAGRIHELNKEILTEILSDALKAIESENESV